jgi:hypothetical protein
MKIRRYKNIERDEAGMGWREGWRERDSEFFRESSERASL